MAKPVVSIIMSVYNGEQFLPDCIKGINSQTFQDYEVIVVDDGSTDGTPDILHKWSKKNDRVRVLTRVNDGLTSALNLAISHANGKYLARHDADDVSSAYRMERQVKYLNEHNGTVLIGTHCAEITDSNSLIALYYPPNEPKLLLHFLHKGINPFVHGSVMMRKDSFERLEEGYRFQYCQDFDLYLRLSYLGKMGMLPELLYALRNNSSRTAIMASAIKPKIKKIIMQVNGLKGWHFRDKEVVKNHDGKVPLWQVLQDQVIERNSSKCKERRKAQYFMSLIGDNLELNNRSDSLVCAMKSIRTCPNWYKTWLSLPYAIIGIATPRASISRLRNRSCLSKYRKAYYAKSIDEIF